MKRKGQIVLLTLLVGIITACGGGRGGFNKQKYTNLKGKTSYSTESTVEAKHDPAVVSFDAEEEIALEQEMTEINVDVTSNEATESTVLRNEIIDELESTIQLEKLEIQDLSEEFRDDEPENGKSESMVKYNEWWNIAILVFILGVLFLAMAIFAVSPLMYYVCLAFGPGLLVASWVLSIYMITLGKKVAPKDRDTSFGLKNTLAWLLAVGGPLGLLLIGGLILLLILL